MTTKTNGIIKIAATMIFINTIFRRRWMISIVRTILLTIIVVNHTVTIMIKLSIIFLSPKSLV